MTQLDDDDGVAEEMLANLMKSAKVVKIPVVAAPEPVRKIFEELGFDDDETIEMADGDSISIAAEEEGILDDD